MKSIAIAILAAGAAAAGAQTQAPAPSSPQQTFPLPPALSGEAPQFKMQVPGLGPSRGLAPQFKLDPSLPFAQSIMKKPHAPGPQIDLGMVKHPSVRAFAVAPSRPAMRQDLYPGLKIQPTEMASVTPLPTLWPDAKMIPIPITWPDAEFEPIPRTIEGFTAAPIQVKGTASPSKR